MNNLNQKLINLGINVETMYHGKIKFSQGSHKPPGFYAYSKARIGNDIIDIKYIIHHTEAPHIPKCNYRVKIERYIIKKDIIVCYVTFPNRKHDEAIYLTNNRKYEDILYLNNEYKKAESPRLTNDEKKERKLLRKNKLNELENEIKYYWISKYNSLPDLIRKFFFIKNPQDIVNAKKCIDADQLTANFHKWKTDVYDAMQWETEFPNIIEFMNEKIKTATKNIGEHDGQLKTLINQITEVNDLIIKQSKKNIFIKSINNEAEVYYDQSHSKLIFNMEIEDDITKKIYNKCISINANEATDILVLFGDVVELVEIRNELNNKLNQERITQTLSRQLELQQIAEKYLSQELIEYARNIKQII